MYLLTLVLLIIAVLGTYTQVLGLQAARIAAGQTALAQTMIQWHQTALGQAAYAIPPANFNAMGGPIKTACALSPDIAKLTAASAGTAITGLVPCYDAVAGGHVVNAKLAVGAGEYPACTGKQPQPECQILLPPNFGAPYEFGSIAYQIGGINLVLTYMQPNGGTPNYMVFANGTASSLTSSDLQSQLLNTSLPKVDWGVVKGGVVVKAGTAPAVPLPLINGAAALPLIDGSIVIIQAPVIATCTTGPRIVATGMCP